MIAFDNCTFMTIIVFCMCSIARPASLHVTIAQAPQATQGADLFRWVK